jgi:hypothetical protein
MDDLNLRERVAVIESRLLTFETHATQRMHTLEASMQNLQRTLEGIRADVHKMEVRVAVICAVSGLAGSGLSSAVQHVLGF